MRDKNRNYDEKSTLAVLLEIAKLLVLLLWKGVKAVGRWILKFLKFLLRWVVKGLLAIIDFIIFISRKIKSFWNNNDTQEKVHKILRGLKKGAIAVGKGILIGLIFLGKGIVWLLKKLFIGLIHLNKTLKTFWKWLKKTAVRFGKWVVGQGRCFKAWCAKKKVQYKSFRKNKGFKGLLIDLRDGMKGEISTYIEDDQSEGAETASTDDDDKEEIIEEDADEEDEDDENVSGVRKFGRRIYRAMKRLVEV